MPIPLARIALGLLPVLLGASLAACSKGAEPAPPASSVREESPTTAAGPDAARPSAQLAWDAPAAFTKVDHPSSMRKATYQAPKVGSDAEAPELAVTQVGGSVDANIQRWVGQFDPADKDTLARSARKVGPYDVTIVEMRGTFQSGAMMGGPPTPKPGWALLAAIVPAGDSSWFFKMTGPEASVLAARADFDALVGSFRPGG